MKSKLILCILLLSLSIPYAHSQANTGAEDRIYWIQTLSEIADPVLKSMSKGELKKKMPVETVSGTVNPPNTKTTHLEAIGRLFVGIAPWLELGPDDTAEGKLRTQYIQLTLKSIAAGFDPASPDYLNFILTRQPLVDAAFFCQGLLRAPKQVWGKLPPKSQKEIIDALQEIRKIKPVESNWLLFSAMVETTLLELTGEWNAAPVNYALSRFKEWYKGDAWYGDGKDLHMDYYQSYVIHPMLMDILIIMQKHHKESYGLFEQEKIRFTRYAEQQERLIAPDGAYPVFGRSIAYRFGSFHALSQAALLHLLPNQISEAQVRSGLTAVIKRHMQIKGNFDDHGWLTLGFCGHQPEIAERYISTGSLYLCTTVFAALGLPPTDIFWSSPYAEWTGKKLWKGDKSVRLDKALKNK